MLTRDENESLTRVGPGTPMGEAMRRYWMPALLSWELPEPDCTPVRVKLLGEPLIAFRDTNNRVGLLDEFCAHRGVSLWLGRNEDCGIRCVFHGWKYDVNGQCVDQMNEPESFAQKVRLKAYPTLELGGIIWAYMGPREQQPPAPKFELTQVPDDRRVVTKSWEECNWLQALEGGLDTSHAAILHRRFTEDADKTGMGPSNFRVRGGAPKLEVETTDYGYRYFGVRPLGAEGSYVRGYHFVMPFTQIRASQYQPDYKAWEPWISGHFWVPADDDSCMVYNWVYSFGDQPLNEREKEQSWHGNALDDVDPAGNFRKVRNKDNNWLIDREIQKTTTFSGILGINTQDHAVQESMGPIQDRSREYLGPADKAIIVARQLLLQATRAVEQGGRPLGANDSYYHLRAIERVVPPDVDWSAALLSEMYPEPLEAV